MRALGTDREELVAAAREQDGILADVSRDHLSVGQRVDGHARSEIGAGRFLFGIAHPNSRLGLRRVDDTPVADQSPRAVDRRPLSYRTASVFRPIVLCSLPW
jgi:hypothetical protein